MGVSKPHRARVATPSDERPQGLLHELVRAYGQPALQVPQLFRHLSLALVSLPDRLQYAHIPSCTVGHRREAGGGA